MYPSPPLLVLFLGVLFALHLSHPEITITSSLICASPTLQLQMLPKFRKQIILWTLEVTPTSLGFYDFLQHNKDQGEVRGEASTISLKGWPSAYVCPGQRGFLRRKIYSFKTGTLVGKPGGLVTIPARNPPPPPPSSRKRKCTWIIHLSQGGGSASSRGAIFCV